MQFKKSNNGYEAFKNGVKVFKIIKTGGGTSKWNILQGYYGVFETIDYASTLSEAKLKCELK